MRITRLKEINVVQKSIHDTHWRIGLVYPNSYSIGMSGLTVKLLYHLLNQHRNVFTERIFFFADLPGPPRSIETGKTLTQFDLLAFSFQFELDYINAIRMLLRSGIPVYMKDRTPDHPLLLAGGPTVTTNPEPIFDIFDIIFSGEFESISNDFLEAIISSKHGILKETILSLSGFFSSEDSITHLTPFITRNLNDVNYPTAQVRPISGRRERKGVLDGYFLQVSRGCIHGCHFCLIGNAFRPLRERSLNNLYRIVDKGGIETKTNFFSLIGSSTADYSQIIDLLEYLIEKKYKFSLPSIRIDSGIKMLEQIKRSGLKSLSIAPESASEDVRFNIGKKITNLQVSDFVQKAEQNKIQELKLYFICGLTSDPIMESYEIIDFLNSLAELCSSLRLSISVTPLIPKRGTRMEKKCNNFREIQAGLRILKEHLPKSIHQKRFPVHWAAIQAILSIGGRELTPIMIDVADRGGSYQSWKKRLDVEPIDYYFNHYCL
ncbi:MAG: B12-binding domain-containing radical SAM protein [Promethearchaeota archaeon]